MLYYIHAIEDNLKSAILSIPDMFFFACMGTFLVEIKHVPTIIDKTLQEFCNAHAPIAILFYINIQGKDPIYSQYV